MNRRRFSEFEFTYLGVQAALRMVMVAGRYIARGFVRWTSGTKIVAGMTTQ